MARKRRKASRASSPRKSARKADYGEETERNSEEATEESPVQERTPEPAAAQDQAAEKSKADAPKGAEASKGIELPTGTVPLFHQTAGHQHGKGKTGLGLLLHEDGSILKPFIRGNAKSETEYRFYSMIHDHVTSCSADIKTAPHLCEDRVIHGLFPLIPEYLGDYDSTFIAPGTEGTIVSYLKLRDLARTFKQPCIADIKIGRITYSPGANEKKILEQTSKFPEKMNIGYHVLGMRNYEHGQINKFSKDFCEGYKGDEMTTVLSAFFSTNPSVMPKIIADLEEIRRWFGSQRSLSFIASSVLIIYEAEGSPNEALAKMIDFAHVHETAQADENYIFGLETLLRHMRASVPVTEEATASKRSLRSRLTESVTKL